MKKISLSVFALTFAFWSMAWHIVGGEIEFITLQSGQYRINLIQYKDAAQERNPGYDASVEVFMYSNKDDRLVRTFLLPRVDVRPVEYSQIECARDELKTERILFSEFFELEPQEFDDAEGYYLVYERCCRNVGIRNIVNPSNQGMRYYLEMPALWRNGAPFINSSPQDMQPLRDYACINQLYYAPFTGTDSDGDSLAYKLVTPLNVWRYDGNDPEPDPIPKEPDDSQIEVSWNTREGYSLKNIIPGTPSLRMTRDGQLQVNPLDTGLYVFSVMVEEWRDDKKIGQAQRDFQMLVVDDCDPPEAPKVAVQIPGRSTFDSEVDTLFYELVDDKCFEFVISNIIPGENISMRAEVVNVNDNLDYLFDLKEREVKPGQQTIGFDFCAPGCPPIDGPFIVDFIASDDACPVPQVDTLRMTIQVESPPNEWPQIFDVDSEYIVNENDVRRISFRATDQDEDSIKLELELFNDMIPEELGFSTEIDVSEKGLLQGTLVWDVDCSIYDYNQMQNFQIKITPEDLDDCEFENPNYKLVNMAVRLPVNTSPEIDLTRGPALTVKDKDFVSLDVLVNDLDGDSVTLKMQGIGFNPEEIGVKFKEGSILGKGNITELFEWDVDCYKIESLDQSSFEFRFITEDIDRCQESNADTITLVINVELEENDPPAFDFYADTIIDINSKLVLDIAAFDPNPEDELTIDWFNPARLPRSESLFFESVSGNEEVHSTLTWTPDCSLVDFGELLTYYDLVFLAYDDGCPVQKLDTMKITVGVRNGEDRIVPFRPPNVFTPNGDGVNDVFTLTNLDNPASNLPADRCDNAFISIDIVNRSGSSVFSSENREFAWDGGGNESGVYYYLITYEQRSYKGYIQLLK